MPSSGIKCESGLANEVKKLTSENSKREYQFMIFKISDDGQQIVIEKCGGLDATFNDMKEALPKDQCRYVLYDLAFKSKEEQDRQKIIFISFVPDEIKAVEGKKMIYSSSKGELVQNIGRSCIAHDFHCAGISDVNLDEFVSVMQVKFK